MDNDILIFLKNSIDNAMNSGNTLTDLRDFKQSEKQGIVIPIEMARRIIDYDNIKY